MWRTFMVIPAIACGGHGKGGGVDAPFTGVETAQFLPQVCTSGLPDDPPTNPNPSCPVNVIALEPNAPGATLHVVFRSDALEVDLSFEAGVGALHVEHPQVVIGDRVVFDFDTTVDVISGEMSLMLDALAAAAFELSDPWHFRFAALDAF